MLSCGDGQGKHLVRLGFVSDSPTGMLETEKTNSSAVSTARVSTARVSTTRVSTSSVRSEHSKREE